MTRACIYVRVSSEKQAEKVSPQAQEKDCKDYAAERSYQVVEVFRDIEKYRAGKRIVEPSGTRADRPGLRAMLAGAHAGDFDLIVAWREDRLYRSYRPMLDVLDTIEETGIDLELVKETFDKRIAPVKAWAAKMELDAKHDRYMMGIANRFEQGKAGNHPPPYGYRRNEAGFYEVDPAESVWVVRLFEWYANGDKVKDIQRRFVAGGAPQRKAVIVPWHLAMIRRMLTEDYYWTGALEMNWAGEKYDIPIPVLIPPALAQLVIERKAKYKFYPAGNTRNNYLAAGLLYCGVCGKRCSIISANNGLSKAGKPKKYIRYQCSNLPNVAETDCFRMGSARLIDERVWAKVWGFISDIDAFQAALENRIESAQVQEIDAQAESQRLERELEAVILERQKVITWARKDFITEDDLQTQLTTLAETERELQAELTEKRLMGSGRVERLRELAELFHDRYKLGWSGLNVKPTTDEEKQAQFVARKKIIEAIVERVEVDREKQVTVKIDIDLQGDLEGVCIKDPASCHWKT